MEQSAFSYHPELEEKIVSPLSSFFRTFSVESIFEENPELHWVLELLHTMMIANNPASRRLRLVAAMIFGYSPLDR